MLKKRIKFLISKFISRSTNKFCGLHRGEACYIFGDGPSVKWFDLKNFSGLPSICCNLMPFHKDFDKLDVRYCTIIEPYAFVPRAFHPKNRDVSDLNEVLKEYKSIIRKHPKINFFVSPTNILSLWGKNINYMFRELPTTRNKTNEQIKKFDCLNGSFYASLMLAYYLGFKKVYLIGFDAWTIQPSRTFHWYELGNGELFDANNFATDLLNVLNTEMDIYTIINHGGSKNVRGINYEDLTGEKPVFKENYEILTEQNLKLLSTCPIFKVLPK